MKRWYFFFGIILAICILAETVSAHEFAKPLYWAKKNGIYYQANINGSLLASNSIYLNNLSAAAGYWNNPTDGTLARCSVTSFSISNVDLFTPSQSTWDSYDLGPGALALAILEDSSYYIFHDYYASLSSTGSIVYGQIAVNPNNTTGLTDPKGQTWVVVHEIGHMYGLWHCPQSTVSIMKPELFNGFTPCLRAHDIDDMLAKYGTP